MSKLDFHYSFIFELSLGFTTKSDTNQTVQPLEKIRGLNFRIKEVEGLYYLCNKIEGVDQLCAFVFAYAKSLFSHDAAFFRIYGLSFKISQIAPIQLMGLYYMTF